MTKSVRLFITISCILAILFSVSPFTGQISVTIKVNSPTVSLIKNFADVNAIIQKAAATAEQEVTQEEQPEPEQPPDCEKTTAGCPEPEPEPPPPEEEGTAAPPVPPAPPEEGTAAPPVQQPVPEEPPLLREEGTNVTTAPPSPPQSCAGLNELTLSAQDLKQFALEAGNMHGQLLQDIERIDKEADGDFVKMSTNLTEQLLTQELVKPEEANQLIDIYSIIASNQTTIPEKAEQVTSVYNRLVNDSSSCPLAITIASIASDSLNSAVESLPAAVLSSTDKTVNWACGELGLSNKVCDDVKGALEGGTIGFKICKFLGFTGSGCVASIIFGAIVGGVIGSSGNGGTPPVPPAPIEYACDDGIDNDGDGWTDGDDADCAREPEKCNDGIDNDRDGLVDENCELMPLPE
jgi:hypothetical protein